ncbi:MAG: DUF3011 domain-containing protein [Rhodanobacteraceae bacterium]
MILRCAVFGLIGLFVLPVSAAHARGNRHDAISCTSQGFRPAHCAVPWRDAELVRQTSDSACVRGRSWGVDRRGIWVDKGCGGTFVEAGRGGRRGDRGDRGDHGDWRPGSGWDRSIAVRCDSKDFRYHFCQVDTGRGSRVAVRRQISDTRCVEGRTWGWNRAGIWVNNGCSAVFGVDRRWR